MKQGRYTIYQLTLAQTVQYLTFSNRIAFERAKLYHKPPESHTIDDNVNPQINAIFLLSTPYNKCHLADGVVFIENIPVTVTVGEIYEN